LLFDIVVTPDELLLFSTEGFAFVCVAMVVVASEAIPNNPLSTSLLADFTIDRLK
jgi:hypothetical protein